MNVLIACEFSGTVRDAFAERGHNAWSCDLLPTEKPGQHYQGNIIDAIWGNGGFFENADGSKQRWDLIIAHPPCTALAVSGNSTYGEGQPKYQERLDSVNWTMRFWNICKHVAERVCFENPVGVLPRLGGMVKPHYVQPYMFGHMEQKKTGLFLHNLPPLKETNNVYEEMMKLPKRERERLHYLPPSKDRWKIRSTTYQGLADAMAEQWAHYEKPKV